MGLLRRATTVRKCCSCWYFTQTGYRGYQKHSTSRLLEANAQCVIIVFSDITRSSPSSHVVSLVKSSLPKVFTNPHVQHPASSSLDTLRFGRMQR